MGKLCIVILLFASSWCSEKKKSVEVPELKYLRISQASDGSWGDKNKVYCTSIALLTFLSNGDTPTSKTYGKSVSSAMKYLISQTDDLSDKDLHILMWSLSESYSYTAITAIGDSINKLLPQFLETIQWGFQENPERFFIQNQAIRSSYTSGIEHDFYNSYIDTLECFENEESLVLRSAKLSWGYFPTKPNKATLKKINTAVIDYNLSLEQDLIIGQILFLDSIHNKIKFFKNKINDHRKFKSYTFPDTFSDNEKKLLRVISPTFVENFTFPWRYLPTSRRTRVPADENTPIYEEGLDLVD